MLNPQQNAAMSYVKGPLLVLAGAGSGKTRVITKKIIYLISECNYLAKHICAVTFTNKAANEMRLRIASELESSKRRGLMVATFHTLGLTIIKKDMALCGLKKGFSIFDSEDSLHILQKCLDSNKAKERDYLISIQQQISHWKNDLYGPEDIFNVEPDSAIFEEAAKIYQDYQQSLSAYNAVDFDDLIRLPVYLLSNHVDILKYWQSRIKHLLVDEYQDSNTAQYQFVKLLIKETGQLTVVGDDDQSIYAWRGARPENLIQLQKDFPQLKVIKLEQNYRSTARILHVANQLIDNNPHVFNKKLWSELGNGDMLRVFNCKDEQDEAEQVVMDLISHKLQKGKQYGQYAILYRGNHQSRIFEKILRQQGIPYRISGGQSWFARTEIKDMFSYLKLLVNEQDDAAFLRIINTPRRGIGEKSIEALSNYAHSRNMSLYQCCDHIALAELVVDKTKYALNQFKMWIETLKHKINEGQVFDALHQMVEESAYESWLYEQTENPVQAEKRMEHVWELIEWIKRLMEKNSESHLEDIINKLILIDILEQSDEFSPDMVQLMTLHASKGLEFPYVYLVGMEEELIPHRSSIENDNIEEERRLAYVGVTRAQKGLTLTLAKKRKRAGEWQNCQPSRFLDELPEDCLEWHGVNIERSEEQSKALAHNHLQGLKQLLNQH